MSQTIDSHHHFWKTAAQNQPWREASHSVLEKDFGPEDLKSQLASAGVDGTVLVQSVNGAAENDRLREYEKSNLVRGVVAWLPLTDAVAAERELDRMDLSKVCGVRMLVSHDPLDWLSDAATIALFEEIAGRGLAWDVVATTSEQVRNILKLAESVQDLRVVIDHMARPPLDTNGWEPWAGQVRDLAACPTVAAKVSVGMDVLSKWAKWSPTDLLPYVDWVGQHFGPSRLMLASNWPVVLLKRSYETAWRDLEAAVGTVMTDQRDLNLVRGGTALRWYALEGRP